MGAAEDQLLQPREAPAEVRLARYLGITPEQLIACTYRVTKEPGGDCAAYSYVIVFGIESPPDILGKILGLQGWTVHQVPMVIVEGPDEQVD